MNKNNFDKKKNYYAIPKLGFFNINYSSMFLLFPLFLNKSTISLNEFLSIINLYRT